MNAFMQWVHETVETTECLLMQTFFLFIARTFAFNDVKKPRHQFYSKGKKFLDGYFFIFKLRSMQFSPRNSRSYSESPRFVYLLIECHFFRKTKFKNTVLALSSYKNYKYNEKPHIFIFKIKSFKNYLRPLI